MHLDSTTMRRELHPLAEIGMNVKRTSEYVLEHLKMIGLEGKYVGDTYGVCAYIDSGVPGPVVMLRSVQVLRNSFSVSFNCRMISVRQRL